jgi:hypothetical protein
MSTATLTRAAGSGEVAERFDRLDGKLSTEDYNFEHFRAEHLMADAKATWEGKGVRPGEPAPDFELPQVGGGTLRLSKLRGQPVLLHFGSFT